MSFPIRLTSPAAPDAVLAALRDNTREWRESVLPPELRQRNMWQVASRIRGSAFTLYYEGGGEHGPDIALRGVVSPAEGGGSRVVATAGLARAEIVAPGILAAVGLGGWLFNVGDGAWLVLPLAAGAWAAFNGVRDRAITREGSIEARYLAERLEAAVAAASERRVDSRTT